MLKRLSYILLISTLISCSGVSTHNQTYNRAAERDVASLSFKGCYKGLKSLLQSSPKSEKAFPGYTQTWGVEIELNLNGQLTQRDMAEKLREFFDKKGFDNVTLKQVQSDNMGQFDYIIYYHEKGVLKKWTVPYEPTFWNEALKKATGFELTTPVLNDTESTELLTEVLNLMKFYGATPAKDTGGIHIHFGTENFTTGDLQKILSAFKSGYDALYRIFKPDSGRRYISEDALNASVHRLSKKDSELKLTDESIAEIYFQQGPIRFNKNYETLEVRIMNSSLAIEDIQFSREFFLKFIQRSLEDKNFTNKIQEMTGEDLVEELNLLRPSSSF